MLTTTTATTTMPPLSGIGGVGVGVGVESRLPIVTNRTIERQRLYRRRLEDRRKRQRFRWFCGAVVLIGLGVVNTVMNQRRIFLLQKPKSPLSKRPRTANRHRLWLKRQDLYPFDVQDYTITTTENGGGVRLQRKPQETKEDSFFSLTKLRECVTVRQASSPSSPFASSSSGEGGIGWIFVEDVEDFYGLHHLFHYIEFLVIANAVMAQHNHNHDEGDWKRKLTRWVHTPHFAPDELVGSQAQYLNFLLTQAVLGGSTTNSGACLLSPGSAACEEEEEEEDDDEDEEAWGPVQMYGREVNNEVVRSIHPLYNDTTTWNAQSTPLLADMKYMAMLEDVDTVVLISRQSCHGGGINKMWFSYMDRFDALKWYQGIHHAVQQYKRQDSSLLSQFSVSDKSSSRKKKKLVVTYIDRQDSHKRFLSQVDHDWILQALGEMEGIDFRHVSMHKYNGIQQMILAHDSQVLLGCHGNGLTHQFWMEPHSLVVELFWHYTFQYDYFTAARIMRHDYVGIFQGHVMMDLEEETTQFWEATWLDQYRVPEKQAEEDDTQAFLRLAKDASQHGHLTDASRKFLLQKIQELVKSGSGSAAS